MIPIADTLPRRRVPLVTWALITVNTMVFIGELTLTSAQLEQLFYLYGVVPLRYTHPAWADAAGFPQQGLVPFITAQFLHGGWVHLIFNMWSLWIFGDNVEDRLGRWRFLIFYLLCGVAATFMHLVFNSTSPMPMVGASGAIAGVLGAYFLMYPLAGVLTVIPIFFYPLVITLPAFLFMLFWFFVQLFSGALSLMAPAAGGGIAWWAHISGFVTGMLLHRLFIQHPPPLPPQRPRRIAPPAPRP
ncbi:MAG: rhomboid family intramembrane serine protease [Candidatus Hydrogenedentota bacterium]